MRYIAYKEEQLKKCSLEFKMHKKDVFYTNYYFLGKTIAQKIFLVYNDSEEREVKSYVDLFEIKQLFYLQQ